MLADCRGSVLGVYNGQLFAGICLSTFYLVNSMKTCIMTDTSLQEKVAYFEQQELLHLSDDETHFPDPGLIRAEHLFYDTKTMPPPPLNGRSGSFKSPGSRERQQDFQADLYTSTLHITCRVDRRLAADAVRPHGLVPNNRLPPSSPLNWITLVLY